MWILGVRKLQLGGYPVEAFGSSVVFVVTALVLHVQEDVQTAKCADGEPKNIEGGVEAVFGQVTDGDVEIIADHGRMKCRGG